MLEKVAKQVPKTVIYHLGWGQQLLLLLLSARVLRWRHFQQIIYDLLYLSSFRAATEYCFTESVIPFLPHSSPIKFGSFLVSAHIARQEAFLQLPDCLFTSKASREWEAQQRPHSCNLFALQPGCCTQFSLPEVLAAPSKTSSHNWAYKIAPEEKTRICCTLGRSPSSPGWCRF